MTYLSAISFKDNRKLGFITFPILFLFIIFISNIPFVLFGANVAIFVTLLSLITIATFSFITFNAFKKQGTNIWQFIKPPKKWLMFILANIISIIFLSFTIQRVNDGTFYWSIATTYFDGGNIHQFNFEYLLNAWNAFSGTMNPMKSQYMYIVTGNIVINFLIVWAIQKIINTFSKANEWINFIILFLTIIIYHLIIFSSDSAGLNKTSIIAIILIIFALSFSSNEHRFKEMYISTLALSVFTFGVMLIGFMVIIGLSIIQLINKKINIYEMIIFSPIFFSCFIITIGTNKGNIPHWLISSIFLISLVPILISVTNLRMVIGLNLSERFKGWVDYKVLLKYFIITVIVVTIAFLIFVILTWYKADHSDPFYKVMFGEFTTGSHHANGGGGSHHTNGGGGSHHTNGGGGSHHTNGGGDDVSNTIEGEPQIKGFSFNDAISVISKIVFIIYIPNITPIFGVILNFLLWIAFIIMVVFLRKDEILIFVLCSLVAATIIGVVSYMSGLSYVTLRISNAIRNANALLLPIVTIAFIINNWKKTIMHFPSILFIASPMGHANIGNAAVINLSSKFDNKIISNSDYNLIKEFDSIRDTSKKKIYSDVAVGQLKNYAELQHQDKLRAIQWSGAFNYYNWIHSTQKYKSGYVRRENLEKLVERYYIQNEESYKMKWDYLILQHGTEKILENKFSDFHKYYKKMNLKNENLSIYERV